MNVSGLVITNKTRSRFLKPLNHDTNQSNIAVGYNPLPVTTFPITKRCAQNSPCKCQTVFNVSKNSIFLEWVCSQQLGNVPDGFECAQVEEKMWIPALVSKTINSTTYYQNSYQLVRMGCELRYDKNSMTGK